MTMIRVFTLAAIILVSVTAIAEDHFPLWLPARQYSAGSYPKTFTEVNGRTVFFANTSANGRELWSTDGTAGGTFLLKDIQPGWRDGIPYMGKSATVLDGFAYTVTENLDGMFLCKTDGTVAGTTLIPILPCAPCNVYFAAPVTGKAGGILYFVGPSTNGNALWRSDGTPAGTSMIKDGFADVPAQMTDVAGLLFFTAATSYGSTGPDTELWRSDGTPSGTVRIKDINPGPGTSAPAYLTAVGGVLYFAADDGTHGSELWKSDGTATGTMMVVDLYGSGGSAPTSLTSLNGALLFTAFNATSGREWYKTDGTGAGTLIVNDSCPGTCSGAGTFLGVLGSRIYYGSGSDGGQHLWATDGTAGGTVEVSTIAALTAPSSIVVGSTLFFTPDRSRLWRSDGTTAGTVEISQFIDAGQVAALGALGETLLFANDRGGGPELWKSDGSGIELLKNINPDLLGGGTFWLPLPENRITLAAPNLTATDGSRSGLTELQNVVPFDRGVLAGKFDYYPAAEGTQLWRTDGTGAGTIMLIQYPEGTRIQSLNNVNGILYFAIMAYVDIQYRSQVWRSDGTPEGTTAITTARFSPGITKFASIGSLVFFAETNNGVWVTDGTDGGTRLFFSCEAYELLPFNGALYIGTTAGLWKANAGFTSATLVDGGNRDVTNLAVVGSNLLYYATRGSQGLELSKTDGTTAGIVKELCVGSCSSVGGFGYTTQVVAGNVLFFSGTDTTHGNELWRSDGTEAGTVLVADICLGVCSSIPYDFATDGRRVYFTANDGVHGEEPWVSDGTVAGTYMLADLEPGSGASSPYDRIAMGNLFFVQAYDSTLGYLSRVFCMAPAAKVGFKGPLIVELNSPVTLSIGAVDSTSQIVPCFHGNIHFSSTDSDAILPPDMPFVSSDGFKTALFRFKSLGQQTITATDVNGTLTGTFTIHVAHATTTALTSTSPNPEFPGVAITFRATVTAEQGNASGGTVTFFDLGLELSTVSLAGNVATLVTSALAPGQHEITATYNGTDDLAPSTSDGYPQRIRLLASASIRATRSSSTSIGVAWAQVSGAVHYEILRATGTGVYGVVGTFNSTSYADTSAVPNTVYLYRVQGVDSSAFAGAQSAADIGTTVGFTDDVLVPGMAAKAIHIAELRGAIDMVRAATGLPAATYTNSVASGSIIRAVDFSEMRSAIDATRAPLGLPPIVFADPSLLGVPIRLLQVNELRDAVR
jgi:ELWxxDGT repeat protein